MRPNRKWTEQPFAVQAGATIAMLKFTFKSLIDSCVSSITFLRRDARAVDGIPDQLPRHGQHTDTEVLASFFLVNGDAGEGISNCRPTNSDRHHPHPHDQRQEGSF